MRDARGKTKVSDRRHRPLQGDCTCQVASVREERPEGRREDASLRSISKTELGKGSGRGDTRLRPRSHTCTCPARPGTVPGHLEPACPRPGRLRRAGCRDTLGDLQEEVTSWPLGGGTAGLAALPVTSHSRKWGSRHILYSSEAALSQAEPEGRVPQTLPLTSTKAGQTPAGYERGRCTAVPGGDGPSPGTWGKASKGISGTAHSACLPHPSEQPRTCRCALGSKGSPWTTGPAPAGTSTQITRALKLGLLCHSRSPRTSPGPGNRGFEVQYRTRLGSPGGPGGLCGTRAGPFPVRGRSPSSCRAVSERAGSQGGNERKLMSAWGPAFLPNVTHRPKWVLKSPLDLSREKAQGEGTGGRRRGRPCSARLASNMGRWGSPSPREHLTSTPPSQTTFHSAAETMSMQGMLLK